MLAKKIAQESMQVVVRIMKIQSNIAFAVTLSGKSFKVAVEGTIVIANARISAIYATIKTTEITLIHMQFVTVTLNKNSAVI